MSTIAEKWNVPPSIFGDGTINFIFFVYSSSSLFCRHLQTLNILQQPLQLTVHIITTDMTKNKHKIIPNIKRITIDELTIGTALHESELQRQVVIFLRNTESLIYLQSFPSLK